MSLSFLQDIGMTRAETALYEALIKFGEVPVGSLIRETKLKRPTVYKSIYSLKSKGLVEIRDLRKKLHVRAESPVKLAGLIENRHKALSDTKQALNALLPGFIASYTSSAEKPVARTYEGVSGLKEIYEDLIRDKKPIFAILQAAEVEPELYEWLTKRFVKKRVKAKIHVKAIVASSRASRKYLEKSVEEYRIARLVDSKKFPFQHEIDIYGDKVAIINYKKDEPLIGMIIQHPAIATTMKAWFDLAWQSTRA